ncbi:amino acid permease [Promicromonospora soli]
MATTGTTSGTAGVTYTQADGQYFEKRQLRRSAGFWGLWGIGIAAVISGQFSGWNSGLGTTGWGAMLIATVVIAVMYFTMIFSIGEMSAAMPHTGGAYSFARSAMGPWAGFITGFAESIEYVVTTGVVVWFSGVYADSALTLLTGASLPEPVWWAIIYAVFVGLNALGASIGFRFSIAVAVISLAVLAFFAVSALASGSVDFSRLLDMTPADGGSALLPFGSIGILYALPFAIWFFLGIEELPLAAEEAHDPARDIPRASVWGTITLVVFAFMVLFLNPAVTGSAALAESPGLDEPLLHGFRAFMPDQVAAVLALFALVALLASTQGIIFAAGRNLYSLSRAGYYPKFLSLTGKKHQTPWVALVTCAVIGYLVLTFVLVVLPMIDENSAGQAAAIVLTIAVFGAVIAYVMQMVSFVLLRRKFPAAKRPYLSPTGTWGAVVAGVIAVASMVGMLLNSAFHAAVVTFAVAFVVGLALFALVGRKHLVLSPEEEYAMSGGLSGAGDGEPVAAGPGPDVAEPLEKADV